VACGASRPKDIREPLEVIEGDLAELTAECLVAMRTMTFGEMASRRRSEAELREFARARGYHHRWVLHWLREQAERAA
jgi:hypothetical protein